MSTPTPRTDMATYPADCLGTTLVTNRDCSRALERELATLTAERDQLRAALALGQQNCDDVYDDLRAERDAALARAKRAEAALADERAQLDSGQILLTVAGERVWHSGVDLRAAIDAGMKEGSK